MSQRKNLLFSTAFAVLLSGLFAASTQAATVFTGAVDNDVNTAGNWDNGQADNLGNVGTIPGGFNATSAIDQSLDGLDLVLTGNATLANLNASGGNKVNNGSLTLQDTSVFNSTGTLSLGRDGDGPYTLNVEDSGAVNVSNDFKVGQNSAGTANQSGGTVNVDVDMEIGNAAVGIYNLSGGALNVTGLLLYPNDFAGSALNFTTGSTGVATFGAGGADYTAYLEGRIASGQISLNGGTVAASAFAISYSGSETSIQLAGIPEPATLGLALMGACMACSIRKQR